MTGADEGPLPAQRPFRRVVTEFCLDEGWHPKRSGYRPLWRISRPPAEPLLIGMSELDLGEADEIRPGETREARWIFADTVQGYIERYLKAGDTAEICDGPTKVGSVRVVAFEY